MTRTSSILAVAIVVLATACIDGVEPPTASTLVTIPGGAYTFGSEELCFNVGQNQVTCAEAGSATKIDGLPPVWPTVEVNLPAFRIEESEVTNYQYRYCVAMGKCAEPLFTNAGDIGDYYGNPTYDRFPVVNVTAEMAEAYCAFVGRRLPSEAEWERAAAGNAATGRLRSTIHAPDGSLVPLESCNGMEVTLNVCMGGNQPSEVKKSAGDWREEGEARIWDLAGNVSEWVAGPYKANVTCAEPPLPADCDCFGCDVRADRETCIQNCYTTCDTCRDNPACFSECRGDFGEYGIPRCLRYTKTQFPKVLEVKSGAERPVRGGSFATKGNLRCRARTWDRTQKWSKETAKNDIGFRCAAGAQ